MEEACSAPVLRTSSAGVQVLARSDAVVLEPALLVLLARAASRLDTTKVCFLHSFIVTVSSRCLLLTTVYKFTVDCQLLKFRFKPFYAMRPSEKETNRDRERKVSCAGNFNGTYPRTGHFGPRAELTNESL